MSFDDVRSKDQPVVPRSEVESQLTVDDLCNLANSFAEQGQYDKSIALYESACKVFPENLALKINLGRIKNLKRQLVDSPSDFISKESEEEITQSEIVVDRCQSLGDLFLRSGRAEEARHIYEISKLSQRGSYLPYYNLGKLYLEMKEPDKALQELEFARELNPFDLPILEALSQAYLEVEKPVLAIEAYADALLISGEGLQGKKGPYRQKIRQTMKNIPGFGPEHRNQLIKARKQRLSELFAELQGEIQKMGVQLDDIKLGEYPQTQASIQVSPPAPPTEVAQPNQALLQLAKQHLIFRNMDEKDIAKLAPYVNEMSIREGDFVYHEGDPIYGIYLLNRGRVELKKQTQFGAITYTTFEKGSFFGDDNLMNGRERYTSALAATECDLLFVDKAGLAMVFAQEKRIAIHFLWYFWKSLSFQIRDSNERMKNFFSVSSESAMKAVISPSGKSAVPLEVDQKIEVLQAKGLSTKELGYIARLSNEEKYNQGETIFQEGDQGDRLYIVLEGSVAISKRVPGVGDETLSVLKKGDFFGEMSLAGHQHVRSADARAMQQNTALLVITRQALKEILSIDVDSAYQFLSILCRILSQRLLELNEKIYHWRMMSGAFH